MIKNLWAFLVTHPMPTKCNRSIKWKMIMFLLSRMRQIKFPVSYIKIMVTKFFSYFLLLRHMEKIAFKLGVIQFNTQMHTLFYLKIKKMLFSHIFELLHSISTNREWRCHLSRISLKTFYPVRSHERPICVICVIHQYTHTNTHEAGAHFFRNRFFSCSLQKSSHIRTRRMYLKF